MKHYYLSFLVLALMIMMPASIYAQFLSVSPLPESKYHNPEESIILNNASPIDESSLHGKGLFTINGSLSGDHKFEVRLAGKMKIILLKPEIPFSEGERVTVNVSPGIKKMDGEKITGTSFSFFIRDHRSDADNRRIAIQMQQLYESEYGTDKEGTVRGLAGEPSFPEFSINANNNPASGQIFFHNFSFVSNTDSHYCIIQNNGDSVFGKFDTVQFWGFDVNHNGYLTLNDRHDTSWIMLDSNYRQVASYKMGNGYIADVHDFQIFPDGHRYMMAYDPQIVDMTVYNPNYQPNATVTGLVIQELDASNNVLFQWRSWDHFQITDCDHINLAFSVIDAVHGNSIEELPDGNILLSSRHLSELTKINRATGDIIWRLGGKNNQFTFINDADKFTFQHDARMLSNGNITLFDNGNYHTPSRSWAKEYQINEAAKTATLVWSYSRTINGNNLYANALGSVQRLSNGNTFICWGNINGNGFPNITELDANKNIVWELQLDGSDLAIYRSHKHDWQPCARPSSAGIYVNKITSTTAKIHWTVATNAASYDVQYRKANNNTWKTKGTSGLDKKLKNLAPNKTYEYEVRSHCSNVPTALSSWSPIMTFVTLPLKEISEPILASQFLLYPNPASEQLNIEINSDKVNFVSISFFDVSGKMILHSQQELTEGNQLIQFDISKFPAGVYVAEIKTEDERSIQKFVKN